MFVMKLDATWVPLPNRGHVEYALRSFYGNRLYITSITRSLRDGGFSM